MTAKEFVLTLVCPERVGTVRGVSGFLAGRGCNITDSQQFTDRHSGLFFLRMSFKAPRGAEAEELRLAFAPAAASHGMEWQLHATDERPRILIMASRQGHCLNDLLYRWSTRALGAEVVRVVSNHTDLEGMAYSYGVLFTHLPVTASTKAEAERRLLDLVDDLDVDLVVLARYMQILSDGLCAKLAGRAINIHHSILPSFKGARPYHQAFQRGVKLIGATAHYVTSDLDEGPIIEQDVVRVDHTLGPEKFAALGQDVERLTLAKAVQWHLERRVLLNGDRTVVFR